MPSFFAVTPKSQTHDTQTNAPTEEIGIQAATNQQSKTKGHQRAATQLVFSTHEKHPLHKTMQRVFYYSEITEHHDMPAVLFQAQAHKSVDHSRRPR